ncbi:homoserine kinase [Fastidiosibacter lacustris]|uniref:homoserine kinase n=1 Tax=Fastidiosibacter lacustris TaxID=2056695 RepID=UPI001EFD4D0D|nr:homoserine kinase [Fastidiosibacter lacustris]
MDRPLQQEEMKISVNDNIKKGSAFAPATSANFAVGFDLMGFAISGVGDIVHLTRRDDDQLVIKDIKGVLTKNDLSLNIDKNVCGAVIKKFINDHHLKIGLDITIEKGIPIGSGIGGSAASSVAAILAVNEFLQAPLPKERLIDYAIYGESLTSGGAYHGDNAVPAMFGGLVLLQNSQPCKFIQLPTLELYAAVVVPKLQIETKEARKLIDVPFNIKDFVAQSAKTAAVISALYEKNIKRLTENFIDILVEPKRKLLIRGYDQAKDKALALGALGFGISGSGPAVFALACERQTSTYIASELQQIFQKEGLDSQAYVNPLNVEGARIITREER